MSLVTKRFYKAACLTIAGFLLTASWAQAEDGPELDMMVPSPQTAALLEDAVDQQMSDDFRVVFIIQNSLDSCNLKEDTYVGQVEMRQPEYLHDMDGTPRLVQRWVKLDKFYAITAAEFKDPKNTGKHHLMDIGACVN